MTIDVVTSETMLTPLDADYPAADTNAIVGYIYYARLLQGSANGLAMVPIEATGAEPIGDGAVLSGFYRADDGRERIDVNARACAARRTNGIGGDCTEDDVTIDKVRTRIFGSTALNANSRTILFAWDPIRLPVGGPTNACATLGCPTSYAFQRFTGAGVIAEGQFDRADPGCHHHRARARDARCQRRVRDERYCRSDRPHSSVRLLVQLRIATIEPRPQLGRDSRRDDRAMIGAGRAGLLGAIALPALALLTTAATHAVWGVPDQVPGATLLVPLLETGVDLDTHPHDTLTTVFSTASDETVTIHWHVWTRGGLPVFGGNATIEPSASLESLVP